jgi:uncharacterized membrane protein YkoI
MKKITIILVLLFAFLLSGCTSINSNTPEITKEEAKQIVVERHTGNIGEVKIKSVSHKNGEYIIEWENKENCESGTDYIDDENGEIKRGKNKIC